jgi:hypothetical protein
MSGKESPRILKNGRYRHGGNATGTHKERAPHKNPSFSFTQYPWIPRRVVLIQNGHSDLLP